MSSVRWEFRIAAAVGRSDEPAVSGSADHHPALGASGLPQSSVNLRKAKGSWGRDSVQG